MSKGISKFIWLCFSLLCGTTLVAQVAPIHIGFDAAQKNENVEVQINYFSEDEAVVLLSYTIEVLQGNVTLTQYGVDGKFLSVPKLPTLLGTINLSLIKANSVQLAVRIQEGDRVIWQERWRWKEDLNDRQIVEATTLKQPNLGKTTIISPKAKSLAPKAEQPSITGRIVSHEPQTKTQEVISQSVKSTFNNPASEAKTKRFEKTAADQEIIAVAQSTLASQNSVKATKVDKVKSPYNEDGEIGGLIIDESRTKMGRDFYEQFFSKWIAPDGVGDTFIIRIKELPSFGRISRVSVVVNERSIMTRSLSPSFGHLEANVNASIRGVRSYLSQRLQMSKDLENEDQLGSGIF